MSTNANSRQRDERGATAVLVALLSLVLLGVGAVAVDMGQVYAKRSALQSNVDMAVLAAAAELNGDNDCNDGESTVAQEYLGKSGNSVDGQIATDLAGSETDDDGFIKCTGWHVDLWAPKAHVDFGLAKALSPSNTGVDVPAFAAAGIFSPDTGVMPAFAVTGCDSGPQTLLDDSPGGSTPPPVPALPVPDTDASLTIKDPLDPNVIATGELTGLLITKDGGTNLSTVTHIAFSTPVAESGLHITVAPTTRSNNNVSLGEVPTSVRDVEGMWYVRVSKDGGLTFSNALRFQVGNPVLECESSPTDGNFGALLLHRDPHVSIPDTLSMNIAAGLDFTLTTFPNPMSDWRCTHGTNGAVASFMNNLRDGTNCVDTDTGLPANAAEIGLLTGAGIPELGRLDVNRPDNGTNSQCTHTSDTTVNFGGSVGSRTLNWDYLTCFFTDGSTTVGGIGVGYDGDPVISEDVFDSPRFFWVPVLGTQPASGGSAHYQIVDFRPGFLTDQPTSATRDNPQVGAGGTENGLGLANTGGGRTLRSLKVVFFDVDALPDSVAATHPTMTYLGVGPKILSLVE